jgi:transketolase
MVSHNEMANAIRFLAVDGVQKANSGHPGMPMGMADVATVLFSKFMKFDAKNPTWFNRDRFVLSAGHGSMLLYSLLYLTGSETVTIDELKNFRQFNSLTPGHPEYGHTQGIDTTTGPLGQGIATAVGMAMAERILREKYGKEFVDHYTYVINGDGCLMEGISEEAISLAGHLKLSKMIVLWDNNQITIDGDTSVATSTDQLKRFEASGWETYSVDGHNPEEIEQAIAKARTTDKPSFISCKTKIGFGAPTKEGTSATHGAPLGDEEIAGMREKLGWNAAPFEVPAEILKAWNAVGSKASEECKKWCSTVANIVEFQKIVDGELDEGWNNNLKTAMEKWLSEKPKVATRKASQMVLEEIVPSLSTIYGGSADLTGSNLTKTTTMKSITPEDFSGNYIHYGVREHAMAAAMNGLCLHGGIVPYSGAFFVFSDYLKPALRLSALMNQGVIYVLTHDSIGLGEDGPTHQPIEHLAASRAIPNVNTFRPCDIIETAECWEIAVENRKTPSVLTFSRQGLPVLRDSISENRSAKGGYIISDAKGKRDVTIIATGSEVEISIKAQEALAEKGINAAVVSMPCTELFDAQDKEYRDEVLGTTRARVAVEALSSYGWHKYVGLDGEIVAMEGFGASAPAEKLFEHFNITTDAVVKAALKAVENTK